MQTSKKDSFPPKEFRELRKRAGFKTVRALASHLTVTSKTVSCWENGHHKIPYSVVRYLMEKSYTQISDMIDLGLVKKSEVAGTYRGRNLHRPV